MRITLFGWAKYSLFLLLTVGLQAQAEVNISGFASMRATALDSDIPLPEGHIYSDLKGNGDVSFKDESLFGLQMSADLTEGLSATVQLLAEGSDDFDVNAKWAYLNYQINDSHQLKMGRLANPLFRQSQYQDVGYAHNYARLPRSVYLDFDFDSFEAVALDSTFFVNDYTIETKLFYGNWDETELALNPVTGQTEESNTAINDEMGINLTISGDWWQVFGGYILLEADFGNAAFDFTYAFAGFTVDYNNILLELETVTYEDDDNITGTTDAYLASIGYRYEDFVFTVHSEKLERDGNFSPDDTGGWGATLRYDFNPSAAIKIDYFSGEDKLDPFNFVTMAPGTPSGDFSIASIGIDLVF